jgi:hypothetical protein
MKQTAAQQLGSHFFSSILQHNIKAKRFSQGATYTTYCSHCRKDKDASQTKLLEKR